MCFADQTKKEIERRQEEERIRMENILSGNPLLTHYSSGGAKTDHKVKRRWDDDVVFKNCAKSEPEKKTNVFINDSLRSEFHKKFMEKYVKWLSYLKKKHCTFLFIFHCTECKADDKFIL